jgi:hypothetical protein
LFKLLTYELGGLFPSCSNFRDAEDKELFKSFAADKNHFLFVEIVEILQYRLRIVLVKEHIQVRVGKENVFLNKYTRSSPRECFLDDVTGFLN